MSSEKYYDDLYHPKSTYPRNDGTTTFMKTIRLTKEESETWKSMKLSKRIHKILAGEDKSNDSIRNKLKQVLRVYDKLFRDNIDYVMNNEKMSQFIQDHEDFDLIGEVLK